MSLVATNTVRGQPRGRTISGAVFDSISLTPLRGAIVQVVSFSRGDTAAKVTWAETNAEGHFRLDGLPKGRLLVGFQHEALYVLGIESPQMVVEPSLDSSVTINLAIPSALALAQRLCGSASGGNEVFIMGRAIDGGTETALPGAIVTVRWSTIEIDGAEARVVPHQVAATAQDDGAYRACGVPIDGRIAIGVKRAGYRPFTTEVPAESRQQIRFDFLLADSAAGRKRLRVVGRVTGEDGSPIATGRAEVAALGIAVPVVNGRFLIPGIREGRWRLSVRALGYSPYSTLVNAIDDSTIVTVRMGTRATTLENVAVVASRSRDAGILSDIVSRNRASAGTMFLPGNTWLETALFPADVVRAARGFRYVSPTDVRARGVAGGCITERESSKPEDRLVTVFLDGVRLPGGLAVLNDALPMSEILAIETYPDVMSAPFMFRSNNACAVIAVWTKHEQP